MDIWARRPRNGEDILLPIYFHDSQVLPVTSNIWYDYIFLISEVTTVQYYIQSRLLEWHAVQIIVWPVTRYKIYII
jgi:hypothetical protein